MRHISRFIVHHSASPRDTTTSEDIRRWHTDKKPNGRGWSDVGYHHIIESDGKLTRGRPLGRMGAHTRGHNQDSVGVCVIGDNTDISQQWTMTQIDTLIRVADAYRLVFPEIKIFGHRDLAATLCPGVDANKVIGDSIWQK